MSFVNSVLRMCLFGRAESTPQGAALIRAPMGLGHGLGLVVTAEGVELNEQAKMLLAQGYDPAQGSPIRQRDAPR